MDTVRNLWHSVNIYTGAWEPVVALVVVGAFVLYERRSKRR
jgi:hypothetical protein